MSMVAHGYGLAHYGSPDLVFSNVLWGYLIRSIPGVYGVEGYSIATLAAIVVVGAVFLFAVMRLGHGAAVAWLILVLALVRPTPFPQFTINAGLLCVAAVACMCVFRQHKNPWILSLGCVLAFVSYLTRSQEFLLVLAVAAPLLPWGTLLRGRRERITMLLFVIALGSAAWIDWKNYQRPEWEPFNALNLVRAEFTDFGAGERLKQRPDILNKYGFTRNDIDLVSFWFFVDPRIADPRVLNNMLDELGRARKVRPALDQMATGAGALWGPALAYLAMVALVVAILRPTWRVAGVWIFCIGATMAMGLMGRPGVTRVYVPLVTLLLLAPFLEGRASSGWRSRVAVTLLCGTCIVNSTQVFSESRRAAATAHELETSMMQFPRHPVAVWGDTFPYQVAYPVLGRSIPPYLFYGLGVFTLAPFSTATAENSSGRGLISRLASSDGLDIIAADLGFLEKYCNEHLSGRLAQLSIREYSGFSVRRVRCESEELSSRHPAPSASAGMGQTQE